MNLKNNLLCIVGIIAGIIFMIMGLRGSPELRDLINSHPFYYYSDYMTLPEHHFNSDYNDDTYRALYTIAQRIKYLRYMYDILCDLLVAFGIFDILFFGIKLNWHKANT